MLDLFRGAAELGNAAAMTQLGLLSLQGKAVARRRRVAMRHFRSAADSGDPTGMLLLARGLKFGWADTADEPGAKQWALKAEEAFRQRAEGGEIAAMIGLAAMYQSGTEFEPDLKQAVTLYQKAAGRGSSEAMLLLAALSFSGEGVEKDKTQAVRWMTQAAERGDPNAMWLLALAYRSGAEIPKDAGKAFDLCRKAAAQGHAACLRMLGELSARGAAEHGSKEALFELG